MSDGLRIPLQASLNNLAIKRAAGVLERTGRALPCSVVSVVGSIVTVKFEIIDASVTLPQVTIPVAGSEYIRLPLKTGDKGVVFGCDAGIGHISGLGAPLAPDLTQPANLSALVFFPIGSNTFASVSPDMLVLTGRSDVMMRDNSHQLQLENEYLAWNTLVSQINSLLLTIGAGLTTPQVLPPLVAATLNPVKARIP